MIPPLRLVVVLSVVLLVRRSSRQPLYLVLEKCEGGGGYNNCKSCFYVEIKFPPF